MSESYSVPSAGTEEEGRPAAKGQLYPKSTPCRCDLATFYCDGRLLLLLLPIVCEFLEGRDEF